MKVLLRASSASARTALDQGKLLGLGAVSQAGCIWISSHIYGEKMAKLVGTQELPILMATERLSQSILSKSHRQDHRRSPQDVSARSRRLAWIVGSTRSAKSIVGKCFACRVTDKRHAVQKMGLLPDERVSSLAPFEATALDLFGPFRSRILPRAGVFLNVGLSLIHAWLPRQ